MPALPAAAVLVPAPQSAGAISLKLQLHVVVAAASVFPLHFAACSCGRHQGLPVAPQSA